MTVIRSAMFDRNQKQLLRQAMISLICDLQRSFYADKKISEREYNEKFRQIDEITEILGIRDTYRNL